MPQLHTVEQNRERECCKEKLHQSANLFRTNSKEYTPIQWRGDHSILGIMANRILLIQQEYCGVSRHTRADPLNGVEFQCQQSRSLMHFITSGSSLGSGRGHIVSNTSKCDQLSARHRLFVENPNAMQRVFFALKPLAKVMGLGVA
jgi:hypothetical protein